jgi:PRTRC genetic system protein C
MKTGGMTITPIERIIRYGKEELLDLNPAEPDVDAIVRMHMTTRPELAAAVVQGPVIENGKKIYTVTSHRGDKG